MTREQVGWALAAAGGLCGVAAAYWSGGATAAFTAASAAFTSASATFGYLNKPKA